MGLFPDSEGRNHVIESMGVISAWLTNDAVFHVETIPEMGSAPHIPEDGYIF